MSDEEIYETLTRLSKILTSIERRTAKGREVNDKINSLSSAAKYILMDLQRDLNKRGIGLRGMFKKCQLDALKERAIKNPEVCKEYHRNES